MNEKEKSVHAAPPNRGTPERKGYLAAAIERAQDFSDSAYFGYMEDMGIDEDELPLRKLDSVADIITWIRGFRGRTEKECADTAALRMQANGWVFSPLGPPLGPPPPKPPTPHWRDLPAGPELDLVVRNTFFKDEPLTYCLDVLCNKAHCKPRSTDLALAMGMLGSLDSLTRRSNGWHIRLVALDGAFAATDLAPSLDLLPYEIVRAKLAAHEAGR